MSEEITIVMADENTQGDFVTVATLPSPQPSELEQLREHVKDLELANTLLAETLGRALGFIRQVSECKSYVDFLRTRDAAKKIIEQYEIIAQEKRIKK
jgi:hypothetical protein